MPSLLSDIRYHSLVRRYRQPGGLFRFSVEICGKPPTWQQNLIFREIEDPQCRLALPSGHGSGKSTSFAVTSLWHLLCFPYSNTLITASNITQVGAAVWKELADIKEHIRDIKPWLYDHIVLEQRRCYVEGYKNNWFVLPKTAAKSKPENIAGMHRKYYMVLADEASGIEDEVIGVIKGGLTGGEEGSQQRFIMASQPTRNIGHFAEAITTLARRKYVGTEVVDENPNGIYVVIQLNAEESPLVRRGFIREKMLEYGGHHSPEYQIKVLGQLPDNITGFLIPKGWLIDATSGIVEHKEPWGWVITVDVAEGVQRDSSVLSISKVSGYDDERIVEVLEVETVNGMDENQFGRLVWQRSQLYDNVTVLVDSDGIGHSVAVALEEKGVNVQRVHWGLPPHAANARKRYKNQRAYAAVKVREALFERRIVIPYNNKVIEQGARIPYDFTDSGQYRVMPKQQMREKGFKSPDEFDTICFFYLADYVPSDSDRVVSVDGRKDTLGDLMKEMQEAMRNAA